VRIPGSRLGAAVVAATAILCAACTGQEASPSISGAVASGPVGSVPGDPVSPVTPRIEPATRGMGARATLHQESHLFVEKDVSILTRRSGIVREVKATRGDRVRPGQVLCVLQNKDLSLALDVARLQTEKARAAFERANRLDEDKAISREDWEAARFNLGSAERSEEMAAEALEKSFVRAPFDGVVSARNVEIGQVLAEDDPRPLFRVTSLSPLLARVYLPQWAYGCLSEGDAVRVKPDSSTLTPVAGRIRWINDVLDPASASAEVLVEVDGEQATLRPGMSVTIELSLSLPSGRLTVPRFALRGLAEGAGEAEILVREGANDTLRRVRIGFKGEDRVEILSGLEEGEEVLLPGSQAGESKPAGGGA